MLSKENSVGAGGEIKLVTLRLGCHHGHGPLWVEWAHVYRRSSYTVLGFVEKVKKTVKTHRLGCHHAHLIRWNLTGRFPKFRDCLLL